MVVDDATIDDILLLYVCLLYTSLSLYFKNSKVKVEIGLAKGKKLYDKREAAAERSAKREMDRTMKSYGRG